MRTHTEPLLSSRVTRACEGLPRRGSVVTSLVVTSIFHFCTVLGCLVFLLLASDAQAADLSTKERPNVVFIFVDDQGYYDLGCYGATEVETPRIDRLANEGIRFADYYAAAPICSPSRAGLLTGCYPRRVGNHIWVHRADSQQGIHPNELTIGELFKQNGYATACIGKWHLGFQSPLLPKDQGFDHYYGLLHNLDPVEVVYFEEQGGVPLIRNGEVVKRPADPAELTERYTDEAIEFIEAQNGSPFFLYLPHTMLHNPLGVSEKFRGSSKWGEYGDAIQELDHHVGRLMDCLERNGIAEKTVVVYASDNGRGPGRNQQQPIRGRKLSTYEGGIRVPAICWGPGLGVEKGLVSPEVTRAMDWYPTLATLAGIRVPEGRVIDGRDISPLLKGESTIVPLPGMRKSLNATVPLRRSWDPPREWAELIQRHEYNDAFFYHGSEGALSAVRWQQWKLVLAPTLQLYNLFEDPSELNPVRKAAIARKLRGMAILFQHEMQRDARRPGSATRNDVSKRTNIRQSVLERITARLDVTYQTVDGVEIKLDLFRPREQWGRLPAVVCIHGGGWQRGNKENHRAIAQGLAAKGFVTASIDYRLSGQAEFPAAIHDCREAVRYLRKHASELGIDPERIGAIGHSAGGHLAALLGTSSGVTELERRGGSDSFDTAVQAVVAMGAQTDLMSERTRLISSEEQRGLIWRKFFGGTQDQEPDRYRLASPLSHLDETDPPFWFITGELDDDSTRASGFRARLKSLGIVTGLTLITNAPHDFTRNQESFDQMLFDAAHFFNTTLRVERSR